jgi:hypothetical protein
MMTTFNEMKYAGLDIDVPNIVLGLVSFLTISLGGLFIGILHGFATALITKTTTQVRGMKGTFINDVTSRFSIMKVLELKLDD